MHCSTRGRHADAVCSQGCFVNPSQKIRGDRTRNDWQESWSVRAVDEAGWARMREQMREKYENLRRVIEAQGASGVEALGGAVGAVAHMAYHLGAIRQKVAGG